MYLMDSSIIQSAGSQREQNLYEIFDTLPQDFLQFNVSTLKRQYRDLSRKYHPDKNPDTDTTAKFMGLKTAYEILGDPDRRILYDIYGQTDFTQDDRMKSMIE
jgi:DnaJ-class molecular chaperone